MNVLFICDEYPPGRFGGIGTAVQTLGRALVRKGHRVAVAGLYDYSYGGRDHEWDQGVEVWRLRYGLNFGRAGIFYRIFRKLPRFLKQYLNGKKAFTGFIGFLNNLIDKEKIEVIEIADFNTFALHIGFIVRWPGFRIPLVLKFHGSHTYFDTEIGLPVKKRNRVMDAELIGRADALSSVSAYTAIKTKEIFQISREVEVLYNAIEIPEKKAGTKRVGTKVIFTGTLIAKKGIYELVKAWNMVNKKIPGASLHIYGKGKVAPLKKILNSASLPTVHFYGHVTRDVIFRELSEAALAVFPSFTESFGLMCIEAMSVGCPVIYTKRSNGPEIINNNENGRLIDPSNISEIAAAVIELLENESLREKFSENSVLTVSKKFNINNSVNEHIEFYSKAINSFNKKAG